jgi:hypothetical protein
MKTKKYRFDNAYESIYKFYTVANAYVFFGKYIQYDIAKKDSYNKKLGKLVDGEKKRNNM